MNDRVKKPPATSQGGSDPKALDGFRGINELSGMEIRMGLKIDFDVRHRAYIEIYEDSLRQRPKRPDQAEREASIHWDFYYRKSEQKKLSALSPYERIEGRVASEEERRDVAMMMVVRQPHYSNLAADIFTRRSGERLSVAARREDPNLDHRADGTRSTYEENERAALQAAANRGAPMQGGGVVLGATVYGVARLVGASEEDALRYGQFGTDVGNLGLDSVGNPRIRAQPRSTRPQVVDVRGIESRSIAATAPRRPSAPLSPGSPGRRSLRTLQVQSGPLAGALRTPLGIKTLPVDLKTRKRNPNGAYDFHSVHPADRKIIVDSRTVVDRNGNVVAIGQLTRFQNDTRLPYPDYLVLEAPLMLKGNPAGKKRSGVTSEGWKRNSKDFWKAILKTFPNEARLLNLTKDSTRAPRLTQEFADFADRRGSNMTLDGSGGKLRWNDYVDEKLEHHHLLGGPFVIIVPTSLHDAATSAIHRTATVVGTPNDKNQTYKPGDGL